MNPLKIRMKYSSNSGTSKVEEIYNEYLSFGAERGFLRFKFFDFYLYKRKGTEKVTDNLKILFDVRVKGERSNSNFSLYGENAREFIGKKFNDVDDEANFLHDFLNGGVEIEISPRSIEALKGFSIFLQPTMKIETVGARFPKWNKSRDELDGSVPHRLPLIDLDLFQDINRTTKHQVTILADIIEYPRWQGTDVLLSSKLDKFKNTLFVMFSIPSKRPEIIAHSLSISMFTNGMVANMEDLSQWGLAPDEFRRALAPYTYATSEYYSIGNTIRHALVNILRSSENFDITEVVKFKKAFNYERLLPHGVISAVHDILGNGDDLGHFVLAILRTIDLGGIELRNGFLGFHKLPRFLPYVIENTKDSPRLFVGIELLIITLALHAGDEHFEILQKYLNDVIIKDSMRELDDSSPTISLMGYSGVGDFLDSLMDSRLGDFIIEEPLRTLATLMDIK